MKISGAAPSGPIRPRRPAKRTSETAAASFGDRLAAVSDDIPTASAASSAAAVMPLVALQEVDGPEGRTAGALRQGHNVLDQLDRLRHALLLGMIDPAQLGRLARTLEQWRDETADPQLTEILSEIELRARVEIEKFRYISK